MPPQTPVERILVLDDDEVMRDLLDALLSQAGYRLTLVSSGEEALRLLNESRPPDLVLTDVQMPGLAGKALAEALRKAIPPGTLLIGMSGSEPPHGTRIAFDAFLLKPFGATALAEAVRAGQSHQPGAQPSRIAAGEKERSPANDLPEPSSVSLPLDETIFQALAKTIPAPQLSQLYEMTLADIAKRHARMQAALDGGDLTALQREAHTVKGSCGFVGASELQAIAASLETGLAASASALAELPAACLRLRSMLKSRLHPSKPSDGEHDHGHGPS